MLTCLQKEPRKAEAPQLRDEYRTYKVLVGCRKKASVSRSYTTKLLTLYSWHSWRVLFWAGGSPQHTRAGSIRTQPGRFVRPLWTYVLRQDDGSDRKANGMNTFTQSDHLPN